MSAAARVKKRHIAAVVTYSTINAETAEFAERPRTG
jgi:hypothetical protein